MTQLFKPNTLIASKNAYRQERTPTGQVKKACWMHFFFKGNSIYMSTAEGLREYRRLWLMLICCKRKNTIGGLLVDD
jgi:hypothetical protein